jgi:Raf kinase inhibitor-like YbhB/YbcL family protein
MKTEGSVLSVSSSAFKEGESIPSRYTCDGENVSPPLQVDQIPVGSKSLVLIVDDPDAPAGDWVHWLAWNIPVQKKVVINEGSKPGTEGVNDFGIKGYGGPCPPSGTHRYFFRFYALDSQLQLSSDSAKPELEKSMQAHVLASGVLTGVYQRNKGK